MTRMDLDLGRHPQTGYCQRSCRRFTANKLTVGGDPKALIYHVLGVDLTAVSNAELDALEVFLLLRLSCYRAGGPTPKGRMAIG
jgi:hypothetical protein